MRLEIANAEKRSSKGRCSPRRDGYASAKAHRSAHILIVDGETSERWATGAALERQGYRVKFALNGIEAMSLLEHNSFDVVLMEIVLQGGQETALLEQIRSRQPSLPVIVMTEVRETQVAIDFMRHGAFDFLLKPVRRGVFLDVVSRALEHRKAAQASLKYRKTLEHTLESRNELLRQTTEDLEQSRNVTLTALGDALDLKDSETEGHSTRVAAYTAALARAMGLGPDEVKTIIRGAFLHDIGKMAIPDEILHKPAELTPEEQTVMREHCVRGYDVLKKIPFLKEEAEIVLSHQERFDGSGYPHRLQGEQIPVGARVFAIADALDAITSDRPYRKASSFERAREEIQRCAGSQFDPEVVEVFLGLPGELWPELRSESTGTGQTFSISNLCSDELPPLS